MLVSTIPLTSTSSCCSVRLMWKRSRICFTVEGPWPKQGRREPREEEKREIKLESSLNSLGSLSCPQLTANVTMKAESVEAWNKAKGRIEQYD